MITCFAKKKSFKEKQNQGNNWSELGQTIVLYINTI